MIGRCAGCMTGPTKRADVAECLFVIPGRMKIDYPLCSPCRDRIAGIVKSFVQSIFLEKKKRVRNLLV